MPSTLEGARLADRIEGPYARWREAVDQQFESAPLDWQAQWLRDRTYPASEGPATEGFFFPADSVPHATAHEPLDWAAVTIIVLAAVLWLLAIVQFARWQAWL